MYWCMDESRQYIDRFRIKLIKVQEEMARDRFVQYNPLDNIARSGAKKTVRRKD